MVQQDENPYVAALAMARRVQALSAPFYAYVVTIEGAASLEIRATTQGGTITDCLASETVMITVTVGDLVWCVPTEGRPFVALIVQQ